jgi:LCP family protein required for cell wall assembly
MTARRGEEDALDNFQRRLQERQNKPIDNRIPARSVRPPDPPPQPESARRPKRRKRRFPWQGCLLTLGLFLLTAFIGAVGFWQIISQQGAFNVLVLGIDRRPGEAEPFRSDTMMLARFDPRRPRTALLSIPRDLWVTIPDEGKNRINTAHFFGGPRLAKQTVADNFGLPVHHYVRLDFGGFERIVDALGGIDVTVRETLHDEQYPTADYGVTTIHIEAGPQHFDGATALVYARSRYSTDDFDRARRQQEVLDALRRRLFSPSILWRFPALLQAISSALETDMPVVRWGAIAMIAARSPTIERAVIGESETQPFTTDGGAWVLLPNWDVINPILADLFES